MLKRVDRIYCTPLCIPLLPSPRSLFAVRLEQVSKSSSSHILKSLTYFPPILVTSLARFSCVISLVGHSQNAEFALEFSDAAPFVLSGGLCCVCAEAFLLLHSLPLRLFCACLSLPTFYHCRLFHFIGADCDVLLWGLGDHQAHALMPPDPFGSPPILSPAGYHPLAVAAASSAAVFSPEHAAHVTTTCG